MMTHGMLCADYLAWRDSNDLCRGASSTLMQDIANRYVFESFYPLVVRANGMCIGLSTSESAQPLSPSYCMC